MTNSPALWAIVSDTAYEKSAKKFLAKHPELTERYATVIGKTQINPHDRSLKTHPLHGPLRGTFGVSINDKYRVAITIEIKGREVHLLAIGDHDETYG